MKSANSVLEWTPYPPIVHWHLFPKVFKSKTELKSDAPIEHPSEFKVKSSRPSLAITKCLLVFLIQTWEENIHLSITDVCGSFAHIGFNSRYSPTLGRAMKKRLSYWLFTFWAKKCYGATDSPEQHFRCSDYGTILIYAIDCQRMWNQFGNNWPNYF